MLIRFCKIFRVGKTYSLICQIQEKEENASNDYSSINIKEEDLYEHLIEKVQPSPEQPKPEKKPCSQQTKIIDAKEATDQLVIKNADNYECKSCGKTARKSSDMRRHVEVHIEGLSFECQTCSSTFRSRNALKYHKSSMHNIKHYGLSPQV